MNRRNFLRSLVGGVAATAAVRSWPFRVYSFPTEISIERPCWTITTSGSLLREGDLVEVEMSFFRAQIPELMRESDRLYRVLKVKNTVLDIAPMSHEFPFKYLNGKFEPDDSIGKFSRSSSPRRAGVT